MLVPTAAFKGIVHQKSLTHQLLVPIDFSSIFFMLWNSLWTSNCSFVNNLQNFFFYVQQKKEIHST